MKNLLLLFFIFTDLAFAQNVIALKGLLPCDKWLSARQMSTADYYETAIQGFINGIATATNIEIWNANGVRMSDEQAYLYIDNYCRKFPLEDAWRAGWALANEKTNNALINQLKKRIK